MESERATSRQKQPGATNRKSPPPRRPTPGQSDRRSSNPYVRIRPSRPIRPSQQQTPLGVAAPGPVQVVKADLARLAEAWRTYQATRSREGVYNLLDVVYAIARGWKADQRAAEYSRLALQLQETPVRMYAEPYGILIFAACHVDAKRSADGSIIADADYHAVGEIDYASADGGGPGTKNGVIIYIKAGYHGTESAGVRAYANEQSDFPHESTLNQWFSESQFESYRSLGFEITDRVLSVAQPKTAPEAGLAPIFEALLKRAQQASASDAETAASHGR
jgi:hypothetical protein